MSYFSSRISLIIIILKEQMSQILKYILSYFYIFPSRNNSHKNDRNFKSLPNRFKIRFQFIFLRIVFWHLNSYFFVKQSRLSYFSSLYCDHVKNLWDTTANAVFWAHKKLLSGKKCSAEYFPAHSRHTETLLPGA